MGRPALLNLLLDLPRLLVQTLNLPRSTCLRSVHAVRIKGGEYQALNGCIPIARTLCVECVVEVGVLMCEATHRTEGSRFRSVAKSTYTWFVTSG